MTGQNRFAVIPLFLLYPFCRDCQEDASIDNASTVWYNCFAGFPCQGYYIKGGAVFGLITFRKGGDSHAYYVSYR